MIVLSCGTENPAGSKFCNECGSPLAAASACLREERKVVTALFCDLVGFTATSESADPEDVDWMLAAYFAMARSAIEAYRRRGREVHRRRRGRGLRRARRPRGRSRACGACGSPDLRGRRGARGRRRRPAQAPRRDQHRRGPRPSRHRAGLGRRVPRGDAINTASRIQSVAPEMGVAVGLGDLRGDRGRSSTTRSSSPPPSRASPSRCGSSTPSLRGPALAPTSPDPRHAVHRSRDRPRDAQGHLRQDASRRTRPSSSPSSESPVSARSGSWPSSAATSTAA